MNYGKLLEGKKALVTAGAHGMGNAIAKLFVQQGADVAICGRSPTGVESAAELQKTSPDSFFFQCDMAEGDDVDAFCDETLKRFGHVDIVVNCVGINAREPVDKMTFEKFDLVQKTNFRSVIHINQKLLPVMIERGQGGSFVHISTIHSMATVPLMGSYVSSKGAMNAFSRLMAVELGKYNIRSNVVCPGGVFTMPSINRIKEWLREHPGQEFKSMYKANPQGGDALLSPGHAEDMANACLYLASDMGKYVSGQTLMCDGGASFQAHKAVVYPFPYGDYFDEMTDAYHDTFPYPTQKDIENG